jgi:glycosyltransferase involved in cell wall biosynthesis
MNKINCVISCPISTYSGYGARSRDLVRAIIENYPDWDVKILAQRWGNTRQGYLEDFNQLDLLNRVIPSLTTQPDVWIQVTIPNEFQPIGKFNIGVTAGIETTVCHHSWITGCNKMNLIIGSSTHVVNVLKNTVYSTVDSTTNQPTGEIKTTVPMEVLFEGVDTSVYVQIPENQVHVDLDQISEPFCFLSIGHWMQGDITHDRKNIAYLVKAFLEVFKNKDHQPALILKTSQSTSSILDRDSILKKIHHIRRTVKGKLPNIYLLHGDISDESINELYNHPKVKAMISLTKGEGYGRPLAEFSVTGKPIIATNWSGHTDFLKQEYNILLSGTLHKVHPSAQVKDMLLPDAEWFQPDDGEVGEAMKSVFKEYNSIIHLGSKQQQHILNGFTFQHMKEKLKTILTEYIPDFPKQVELNLPNLVLPKLQKVEK